MKRLLNTLPALAVAGLLGACSSTPPRGRSSSSESSHATDSGIHSISSPM